MKDSRATAYATRYKSYGSSYQDSTHEPPSTIQNIPSTAFRYRTYVGASEKNSTDAIHPPQRRKRALWGLCADGVLPECLYHVVLKVQNAQGYRLSSSFFMFFSFSITTHLAASSQEVCAHEKPISSDSVDFMKSGSTTNFWNLSCKSRHTRQEWIYFLDPPRGLGKCQSVRCFFQTDLNSGQPL